MKWKTESLGEIALMTSGGTPSKKNPEYYEKGTIPWVRSGELENGAICDTEIKITQVGLDNSSAKIFPKGTLLIALYGATIGKLAWLDIEACTNQAVCGIFENEKVSLKYLYYYLLLHRPDLIKQGIGGAQANISQTILKKLMVSYPVDRREQMRIVARIEELFSELDNGVETLRKTKQQLAVYRQAVLKDAFDRVIPDSSMQTIKAVCNDIKVGIVIKPAQYYTDESNGIKAFRSANVREFRINDADWVYLTKEGHECNLRSEIHTGDVLIVRSGYPGTACVVTEDYNNCNAIDILIAVPNTDIVTPEYLCAFTNSPYGRKLVAEKKRGVAQAHLNVGGYSKMEIPVPEILVQKQVVRSIDRQLSVYDSIEKTVDTALQQAEAMRQSILKKAFEGKL